jgi:uncharacterized damage-inducible protein DinB
MTDTGSTRDAASGAAASTPARAGIEQMLYLLDQAFAGDTWHSLLGNLNRVTPEEWSWRPPNGQRTIQQMVAHVGECKLMYENHAFGDATLWWDQFDDGVVATPETALAWLRAAHARLRASVAALDEDAELLRPRRANWGEMKETRWLLAVLIEHDVYHAGEINHLRSLWQGDDRWEYARD